jgi:hypothetical protein
MDTYQALEQSLTLKFRLFAELEDGEVAAPFCIFIGTSKAHEFICICLGRFKAYSNVASMCKIHGLP